MDSKKEGESIRFTNCHHGIGVKLIGGSSTSGSHGIFVKRLLKDGMALKDGHLKVGDQIWRVNETTLTGLTYSQAVDVIRKSAATGEVNLHVIRDLNSQKEFACLMSDELTSASEPSRPTSPADVMETPRSSADTSTINSRNDQINSSSDQTGLPDPGLIMNNRVAVPSDSTTSPSGTLQKRQDIQRLANVFSSQILSNMASTPYSGTNQKKNSPLKVPGARKPANQVARSIQLPTSRSADSIRNRSPEVEVGHFDQLVESLAFLGVNITERQQFELKSRLHIDENGQVSFDQFVRLAQQLFEEDFKQLDFSSISSSIYPTKHQKLPPRTNSSHLPSRNIPLGAADLNREINQLQMENMTLRKQIHTLNKQLSEQVQLTCNVDKDLHKFRLEAQTALDEAAALKEKVLLAAESQKMAGEQEREYENVIAGLEKQIKELKENEARQMDTPRVRKTLAVMGSQVRKSEESKRLYQVATQKLLDFCQYIHDVMVGSHQSQHTPQKISEEALATMSLARNILEEDSLPVGWEQCYNEDGSKYYINHITEETSWYHPITRHTDRK